MNRLARVIPCMALLCVLATRAEAADPWVVFEGGDGPGEGKKVVLISGDEEYRSEEALPQLAKILAKQHGFTCTVLFAIGKDGTIDPNRNDNIPGLEALRKADLMIIATRFRDLPDDQMKEIVDYVESGRPVIGLRTATHAFNLKDGKKYSPDTRGTARSGTAGSAARSSARPGSTTTGSHGKQSTRGILAEGAKGPPDPEGDQGRRHLGPDRRLRGPAPPARRQQAAGARPGRRGHGADRQGRPPARRTTR